MNMRDFWANEAAMIRDKSGVLGKEVLMPVGSGSASKITTSGITVNGNLTINSNT